MSSDLINMELEKDELKKERQLNRNLLIVSAVTSVLTLLFIWYVYNKIQSMVSLVMNAGMEQVKTIETNIAKQQLANWLN